MKLLRGGVLSAVLRHVLARDPIAPVLWEPYYDALDRRLEQALQHIEKCIKDRGAPYVLVQDDLEWLHSQRPATLYTRAFFNSFLTNFVTHYANDQIRYDLIHMLVFIAVGYVFVWTRRRLLPGRYGTVRSGQVSSKFM